MSERTSCTGQDSNETVDTCDLVQKLKRSQLEIIRAIQRTHGKQKSDCYTGLQIQETKEGGEGPEAPFRA